MQTTADPAGTLTAAAATTETTAAATVAGSAPTEIEQLQQALLEKQTQLYALETACLRETERQVELEDSVIAWQDKYDRLYESHKRVQKVNQSLEDKMLKLVDRNTNERAQLTSDVATLSVRLAQANFNIAKLQREIVSSQINIYRVYSVHIWCVYVVCMTVEHTNLAVAYLASLLSKY